MTPGARVAAAIEILDRVLSGTPAEQALTNWARASRFAGSGDRAAVRDHVFASLRRKRSHAALGGAMTGRGLLIGQLREAGADCPGIFSGSGHAPPPLTAAEVARLDRAVEMERNIVLDCPDWLAPELEAALGDAFEPVMSALRDRAPVFLRVNDARTTREAARAALAAEGIGTRPHALAKTALEVTENPRRIQNAAAYRNGLVELQDAASQAVVEMLPLADAPRVLDYCAGGGGKALAMASQAPRATVFAHDADPRRMRDLPARATRAGAVITCLDSREVAAGGTYDLVLCDAPCSGSGAWRRSPEAKWRLDPAGLEALCRTQARILDRAAPLVAAGGHLAYATCSLLAPENGAQIAGFRARHRGWRLFSERRLTPLDGGDGFYIALLQREENVS